MENTMEKYYKNTNLKISKEDYIENRKGKLNENYLKSLFKHSKNTEEQLRKDICNFTVYEIIDFYKTQSIASLESLYVMNRTLRDYTNWALDHNMVDDYQNHYSEITIEHLEKCVNKIVAEMKIIDKETLYNWCDQLPNDSDVFVLLCLFEGINGKDRKEIWSAELNNFDYEKRIFYRANGEAIPVSSKLLGIAKSSNDELIYHSYSLKDITAESSKDIDLQENGRIIKVANNTNIITEESEENNFKEGRRIYNKIMRSLKFLGVFDYMDQNAIINSGKINYIKTRSKELGITPEEFLYSDHIEELNRQFNVRVVRSTFWAKYKDILSA